STSTCIWTFRYSLIQLAFLSRRSHSLKNVRTTFVTFLKQFFRPSSLETWRKVMNYSLLYRSRTKRILAYQMANPVGEALVPSRQHNCFRAWLIAQPLRRACYAT